MNYDDMTLDVLVQEFKTSAEKLEVAKEAATKAQKEYDFLRRVIIPKRMEEMGVDSVKITSIGKGVRIQDEYFVSTREDQRGGLYDWLRDHGETGLITETVNSSTLKAFVTRRIKDGLEYPSDYVNLSVVPTARFY